MEKIDNKISKAPFELWAIDDKKLKYNAIKRGHDISIFSIALLGNNNNINYLLHSKKLLNI